MHINVFYERKLRNTARRDDNTGEPPLEKKKEKEERRERLYRFLLSVFCHASTAQCTRVICAGSAKSIRNGETRRDEDLLVVFNCTGNFHSFACFSFFFFPFFTRYNVPPDFMSDCKMLAFARKISRR